MNDDDLLITARELSRLLHLTVETIHTYSSSKKYKDLGLIPPPLRRPGMRRLLWRREDVQQWIESGTAGAAK